MSVEWEEIASDTWRDVLNLPRARKNVKSGEMFIL